MAYYLAGSAAWQRDNPEFVAGGNAPSSWIRQYRWGPGRDILLADVFSVYPDGRCDMIVHLVHRWDAARAGVEAHGFGQNGLYVVGQSVDDSPTSTTTVLRVACTIAPLTSCPLCRTKTSASEALAMSMTNAATRPTIRRRQWVLGKLIVRG